MSENHRRQGLIIAASVLAIYALIPTRDFYWDGVSFAHAIEDAPGTPADLFFPNHLIYNITGYLVWRSLAAAGLHLRALFVLQAMDAVFAAAAVYLVWDLIQKMTGSTVRAGCGALLFAFSAQWWKFSSDADAYIPSIFFLLASFRWIMASPRPRPLVAGLAHSVAMLFHQLAFLFIPVAALGLMLRGNRPGAGKRTWLGDVVKYGAMAGSLTGAAYWAAFQSARPFIGASRFIDWISVHSSDANIALAWYERLRYCMRGTFRLFFGGRVNRIDPDAMALAGFIASMLVAAAALWILRRRKDNEPDHQHHPHTPGALPAAFVTLSAWILVYVIFLFFWLPQNVFYRMFYLPPIIFMLAWLPQWNTRRMWFAVIPAAVVFVWNFNMLIYPSAQIKTNEVLSFALRRGNEWSPGTVILYGRSHTDLWLISYFNPQVQWIPLSYITVDEVETRRMNAVRGGTVWLEGMAADALAQAPGGQEWRALHIDELASRVHITAAHNIRYYRIRQAHSGHPLLYSKVFWNGPGDSQLISAQLFIGRRAPGNA